MELFDENENNVRKHLAEINKYIPRASCKRINFLSFFSFQDVMLDSDLDITDLYTRLRNKHGEQAAIALIYLFLRKSTSEKDAEVEQIDRINNLKQFVDVDFDTKRTFPTLHVLLHLLYIASGLNEFRFNQLLDEIPERDYGKSRQDIESPLHLFLHMIHCLSDVSTVQERVSQHLKGNAISGGVPSWLTFASFF